MLSSVIMQGCSCWHDENIHPFTHNVMLSTTSAENPLYTENVSCTRNVTCWEFLTSGDGIMHGVLFTASGKYTVIITRKLRGFWNTNPFQLLSVHQSVSVRSGNFTILWTDCTMEFHCMFTFLITLEILLVLRFLCAGNPLWARNPLCAGKPICAERLCPVSRLSTGNPSSLLKYVTEMVYLVTGVHVTGSQTPSPHIYPNRAHFYRCITEVLVLVDPQHKAWSLWLAGNFLISCNSLLQTCYCNKNITWDRIVLVFVLLWNYFKCWL